MYPAKLHGNLTESEVIVLQTQGECRIIQIGCGGTGGYLVPLISKFLRAIGTEEKHAREIYFLIDGDKVEQKNILRQNFSYNDVNKNKADVLAHRYGATAMAQYFDESMEFTLQSLFFMGGLNVILGCVDRVETRRFIWATINKFKTFPIWYIDAGNERTHGQVLVSRNYLSCETNPYEQYGNVEVLEPRRLDIGEFFSGVDGEVTDQEKMSVSCAEMGGQSILMNNMAAVNMFGVLTELLTVGVASVSEIQFGRYRMTNDVGPLALLLQSM